MFYCEDSGDSIRGGWACVSFATADMADNAMRRMRQQVSIFGSMEPLEVRFASAVDEATPTSMMRREALGTLEDARDDPMKDFSDDGHDRERTRRRRRSRSRQRRRSRSRGRRRRGEERDSHERT